MAYVIDSQIKLGVEGPEPEKKFPYWILLGIPLLIIPFMKKFK